MGIQIYGRTTEDMVEAAKIVEQANPDVIDINLTCLNHAAQRRVSTEEELLTCLTLSIECTRYLEPHHTVRLPLRGMKGTAPGASL